MSYSLRTRHAPPTPRLYVVRDELALEGKDVYSAPVLIPTPSSVTKLSNAELVALLVA